MVLLGIVTLRDTVNLGSALVAIAVGVGVIVTYFKGVRWKVEADLRGQTIETLEEGRDAYKLRAERLGAEKDEAQQHVSELEGRIAILERLPHLDFEKQMELFDAAAAKRTEHAAESLLDQIERSEARIAGAFADHERRAQERHEAEMRVMEAILRKGTTR